jgi:two-component system, cell cycle response regulator DivK
MRNNTVLVVDDNPANADLVAFILGKTGYDVRVATNAAEARPIIVIALTAYAMKGDEQRAREAGCDGYISKPIDTRTLSGILGEYLPVASPP